MCVKLHVSAIETPPISRRFGTTLRATAGLVSGQVEGQWKWTDRARGAASWRGRAEGAG